MSTAIRNLKREHFSSTQPCRPGRCINHNQQSKSISGAAGYHQRGIAVYQQPSEIKAKALLDDTNMSIRAVSTAISKAKTYLAQVHITSAVYQPRSAKRKHICAVYKQQSNIMAKALLDDTAFRPVRCINGEQQSKSISGVPVYHQRGIAVNQQQ